MDSIGQNLTIDLFVWVWRPTQPIWLTTKPWVYLVEYGPGQLLGLIVYCMGLNWMHVTYQMLDGEGATLFSLQRGRNLHLHVEKIKYRKKREKNYFTFFFFLPLRFLSFAFQTTLMKFFLSVFYLSILCSHQNDD